MEIEENGDMSIDLVKLKKNSKNINYYTYFKNTCFEEQINRIESAICGEAGRNPMLDALEDLRLQIEKESGEELKAKATKAYEMAIKYQAICEQIPELIRRIQCVANLNEQSKSAFYFQLTFTGTHYKKILKSAHHLTGKLDDESNMRQQLEKKSEKNRAVLFELRKEMRKNLQGLFDKFNIVNEKIATFES